VPSQRDTGLSESRVLLVDGIDGSGKTSFASLLAETIRTSGSNVALVHVDDFRLAVGWDDPLGEEEVYWNKYFDLPALQTEVSLLAGEGTLVVLEGIFCLRLPELAANPLIYLEVDFAVAAKRILLRDTARGRTSEDVLHRIDSRYFPAQRRYRADYSPTERATALIDSTDPAAMRLIRSDWNRLPAPVSTALRQIFSTDIA
jgi:uridine kinase